MALYHALEEEDGCPTWGHLPNEQMSDRPDSKYHATSSDRPGTGHRHVPRRHWCLLVEVKQCDGFGRYRSIVKDENDEDMVVAFYLDNYDDPILDTIRKGRTVAIMYAHQHHFIDGTYGVRVENLDHIKVFPLGLQKFQWLAQSAVKHCNPMADGQRKCHGCDHVAPEASLNRCGGCKQFYYCNKDCQATAWKKGHKEGCKVMRDPAFQALLKLDFDTYEAPFSFKAVAASGPSPPTTSIPASRTTNAPATTSVPASSTTAAPALRAAVPASPRTITAISLNQQPWFHDMFGGLMDTIKSKVAFEDTTSKAAALRKLTERPDVVLITDEGITKRENAQVWDAVLEYVRGGGTAILMGVFSGMTKVPDFAAFFAKAGLSWDSASYHRTTVHLNRGAVAEELRGRLPASYSQKAVNLTNVADVAAWYGPDEMSHIESHVFRPDNIRNLDEVPVAFGKVGQGNLGYIGDVNNEKESETVVLAMCGLLG